MPTGDEYRTYASELDQLGDDAVAAVRQVQDGWHDGVATGGRVATTIAMAVDATMGNGARVASELYDLAGECRRRSVVCDEFSAAMAQYRREVRQYEADRDIAAAMVPPGPALPRPWPPVRPAPWVSDPAEGAATGRGRAR